MSNYFAGVTDIETLGKRYRELLKKYHPDNGGSVSEMQSINAEYDRLFADLSKVNKSDSQSYTYEENEQFKAILNEITGFNMTVQIIGSWIWCFDCY
ncbi:MAG: J domain-containing protein [Lachnospiraceae bacterium]|nr:J domain-containing protein [Lachnospiraceae bacterium]